MTQAFVAELNATIARQQQFAKAGDFEKFMAADNEFHAQLYAAADKQDIWTLVKQPQRAYRPAAPAASALARQGAGHRAASQADCEGDRRRRAR